ncbi:MAG: hypothetical protein GWN81_11065, partial [Phycisphaerae bacterium]|nr:hypothetical protein [Phycisphaerae bacterium]NIP52820.1 hypothetical protein [Phycisphaerae bacterium]NIS51517.1 hypothetical protein [Phycisphaerae bacterium]NIU09361.1 hypothetical protein [Phycisphaerae bacterium]NIX28544.1 hypothetical protein [Phycisphaerae bacterium]
HPASTTILTLRQPESKFNGKSVMGLRNVIWTKTDNKVMLIGHGAHPCEHETYAFFINEPYPAYLPRHIRITWEETKSKAAQDYEVELLLDSSLLPGNSDPSNYDHNLLYVGTTTCRVGTFFDKFFFNLKDVKLSRIDRPKESVMVSGRVVAKKESPEEFASMLNMFEFACNPDVDKNPLFIWEIDAIELYDIPESVFSEALRKKSGEAGYLWSCGTEKGMFYRKEDIELIAARRSKLK